jgi:hypothetical protein
LIRIPLTRGLFAIVDDCDAPLVSHLSWQAQKNRRTFYAVTTRNNKSLLMHRLIANSLPGFQVDHRNGDGLDNRRRNLRIATSQLNNWNRQQYVGPKTSRYKGVDLKKGHWRAQIVVGGKKKHLGYFTDENLAACAYDHAALKNFGPFCRLNFPPVAS